MAFHFKSLASTTGLVIVWLILSTNYTLRNAAKQTVRENSLGSIPCSLQPPTPSATPNENSVDNKYPACLPLA